MESILRSQRARWSRVLARHRLLVWMGVVAAGWTLTASVARAEGIPRDEGFMKEPKVVDYRKYLLAKKWDLGLFGAFSMKNQLTQQYGGAANIAYNFNEFLALDLLIEGGYGSVTDLTSQIRLKSQPFPTPAAGSSLKEDDLAGGGALMFTGQLGLRLTPVYGKFNVTAEVPIHFNFYVVAGAGAAMVSYNEVLGCETDPVMGQCQGPGVGTFHAETHPVFSFNAGGGFRFYISQLLSVRIELRDVIFPDQEYKQVDLNHPTTSRTTPAQSAGLTQTPLVMLGVGFLL